jgi:hypothetical protein
MRLNRWVCAAASFGMMAAGALAEQACGNGNSCTTSGDVTTCDIYQVVATGSTSTSAAGSSSTSHPAADAGDAGNDGGGVAPFGPGDGGPCSGPVGGPPSPTCDPSDEMASGCQSGLDPSCTIPAICGNPNTCEPFVTNPPPGTGVDNFRMRLINLTAPPALANTAIQAGIVTNAVDLPAGDGGAPCGTNGTGLFNWLISIDQSTGMIKTGGAPPSTDPFNVGYCYLNGTVSGKTIAPLSIQGTFSGNTFSTPTLSSTLNIPIFLPPPNGGVVILPIDGVSMSDVTVSVDGNCIGSMNTGALTPTTGTICTASDPAGQDSCSLWHSAGSFSGYITLAQADTVIVATLANESLCVLLTGDNSPTDSGMNEKCTETGLHAGDYCAPANGQPGHACSNGDSVWLSAQFAASAVKIGSLPDVSLCNGGTAGD